LSPKKIWALLDERQGNTSQTLGVAEALGVPFETKRIRFNPLIRLPNFFHTRSTIGMTAASRALLEPPWPDVVISTARRLGLVASYIKSRHPSCFLAQIQWPGWPTSQYDLIATPSHDNIPAGKNVFITLGAPHRVTPALLEEKARVWKDKLSHLPSPLIAVLVGGSTRSKDFSALQAHKLATSAAALANSLGGSLMITTSRRTSEKATQALKEISCPHYFHAWRDEDPPAVNPFYGFLGLADAVITTGDSISMCSEACATGKAVFVYASDEFVSSKHQQFIQALYDHKLARPLLETGNTLFTPAYQLDDAEVISTRIKNSISLA